MDNFSKLFEIPVMSKTSLAFILEGKFKEYSTEDLHYHSCHQILKIHTGITLLVEENRKQPLFSNMTAFIPAGHPHRSTVLGETVHYKSIYFDDTLFHQDINDIVIFDMSKLGVALFDRIDSPVTIKESHTENLDGQCLNLLMKLLKTEIKGKSQLTRIPVPRNPDNIKITEFIGNNFNRKLKLSDFTDVIYYSERHLTRIFKEDLKISIFEYLKLYRIFQSSLMICHSDNPKTITEIALSCGYDSLSSFYKDFKDIFSITPKVFREKSGAVRS